MNFTDTLNAQISLLSLGNGDERIGTGTGTGTGTGSEMNSQVGRFANIKPPFSTQPDLQRLASNPTPNSRYYNLITAEQLDEVLNVRFRRYLNYSKVKDEIIANLNISSEFNHLSNLFKGDIPLEFTNEWKSDKGGEISQIQLRMYFNVMDNVCKEWVIKYAFEGDVQSRSILTDLVSKGWSTFQLIEYIIKNQDKSMQIQELLLLIINRRGSDEYLVGGFMPYVTYMEHLETAIEGSIVGCTNPYRTILMLQLAVQGMSPAMLEAFGRELGEFIGRYPDFSMYELSCYLKEKRIV